LGVEKRREEKRREEKRKCETTKTTDRVPFVVSLCECEFEIERRLFLDHSFQ
jgi:hypothetical protein